MILPRLNVHFLVLGIVEAIIREAGHFFDCDGSDFSVLAIENSCDLFQRRSLGLNVPVLLLAKSRLHSRRRCLQEIDKDEFEENEASVASVEFPWRVVPRRRVILCAYRNTIDIVSESSLGESRADSRIDLTVDGKRHLHRQVHYNQAFCTESE